MKAKSKVAILYSGGKGQGGIETYLEQLFDNFSTVDIELTLFSLGEWPLTKKLISNNVKVIMFPGSRFRIRTVFDIARELKQGSYDLIVSNGSVSSAYARAASLISKVPNLATIHSELAFDYPNPFLRAIYFLVDRMTRFETKRYIAVSKFLRDSLTRSGVDMGKIDAVYNGVAKPNVILNSADGRMKDLGLDSSAEPQNDNGKGGKILLRSLGRLHYVKGFHNLIEAISILDDPKIVLEIGGEGVERDELGRLIKRKGLTEKVRLVGHVDDPYLFITGGDIYIQPSLSEGFGLTVVDAMLCGVPVIVTPSGSLGEIVADGKTGLVTADTSPMALATAIKRLAGDKALQTNLAKAAKSYAEASFSIDKWVKGTAEAYRKAMR